MSPNTNRTLAESQVLIYQTDRKIGAQLVDYFTNLGARVWMTGDAIEACQMVTRKRPNLVFIDMHGPGTGWLELLGCVRYVLPKASVIVTNKHPDLHRELIARERGVTVFLRAPFSQPWIEKALQKLDSPGRPSPRRIGAIQEIAKLPLVRIPMRLKITVPYALLALFFAVASFYLISRYVVDSMQDRYYAQLVDAGKLTSDLIVQEEQRLLSSLRLIANTEGVSEALASGDANRLRLLVLPLVINAQEDAVDLLDKSGIGVLSLYHPPNSGVDEYSASQGDNSLSSWDFVQSVLALHQDQLGDKFAGLGNLNQINHIFVAGPVYGEDASFTGVVLVGKSLSRLVNEIRQDTLAQITIYAPDGTILASTHPASEALDFLDEALRNQVSEQQDTHSSLRNLQIGTSTYTELLSPFELRSGADVGFVGVALAHNFYIRPSTMTQIQALVAVFLAILGVIGLGLLLSHQITQPLSDVVRASILVAQGNLGIKVPSRGNDEVMVLAHAFNYMISGLQEGSIYRDILGRTVSPEVRQALRDSFASGDLRLEGQSAVATVLMSDIRNFTTLSEQIDPPTILNWLNEYYGEIVPVITAHGGVVDKFEGDSMLAFFGILPKPLPAEESAQQACQAAVELLQVIEAINARRAERDEPAFITGIGINTGTLTAGGLGTADRLNYTIIGDTVNTTQRIQGITRDFGISAVAISEYTLAALGKQRDNYQFIPLGEKAFRGKQELIWLYRLLPLESDKSEDSKS